MNINLIYPIDIEVAGDKNRTELPPLGMLYVASSLEKFGHNVKVIGIDEDTEELPESDVDGLAITASTTYHKFKALSNRVLSKRSSVKIAGNTHSHVFPVETLSDLSLDAVIRGEAELVLPAFLKKLEYSDSISEAASGLRGVVYLDKDGNIKSDGSVNKVEDVNSLAFPARSLMPETSILLENRLRGTDKLLTTFITSRGCPYSCNFCANLNNGSVRYRSAENIRSEVEALFDEYDSLGGLLIMDETFTLNRKHVLAVTSEFRELGIRYVISSRADRMTPEVVGALQSSGCVEVKFGMETGSQYLLKRMNKRANLEKFKEGVRTASEGGLYTKLFLMHGFPGENEETTKETIEMLRELSPYVRRIALYRFVPLPDSPVYDRHSDFDLHLGKDPSKYHIYHNEQHWWGTTEDFKVVQEQFLRLKDEVVHLFGKVN
ncbi:MAG: radical SAM protein [Nanoarchaeota archaeon]|nr:B12-binding domain-containing radical SAM protein [Nanoarchaeota archaeon]MBU1631761.1 B12-binding domain-containing radical SAM protein [Nanoarchaeota archaeon]MBU1876043.1 B12-binding domain-containing radical SAM protein [Nanoarchaeota archaeon]